VVNLHIPPIRERPEDILALARHFLNRFALDFKKKVDGFSPDALQKMKRYSWPGNVRELQNAVERAVLLCDGPLIGPNDLTLETAQPRAEAALAHETLVLEELERIAIQRALQVTRGVQKDAAALLGITPRVLNYKIQVLKIDWKAFRSLEARRGRLVGALRRLVQVGRHRLESGDHVLVEEDVPPLCTSCIASEGFKPPRYGLSETMES
jgi:DNA-binding NtrC family response regulator